MTNWKALTLSLLFISCGVFIGCDKKADAPKTTDSTVSTTEPSTPENGLSTDQIPADLRTEGFDYYGLAHTAPIEFEVMMPNSTTPETGTANTKLTAVKDGVATFVTERTGPLEQLGEEEIVVKKDGIYNTKIGGQAVEPVQLVMPADVPIGKTWTSKGKIELQNGQTFTQDMTFKVAKQEKIKTKAGEFDALKITAQGTITVGEKRSQSNIAAWYVKGLGTVKMEITTSDPKGKMTVEATKTS